MIPSTRRASSLISISHRAFVSSTELLSCRWRWLHALDRPHAQFHENSRSAILSDLSARPAEVIPSLLTDYSSTLGQSEISAFFRICREQKLLNLAVQTLKWLQESGQRRPANVRPTLKTENLNDLLGLAVELKQFEFALELVAKHTKNSPIKTENSKTSLLVAPNIVTINLALRAAFGRDSSQVPPRSFTRSLSLCETVLNSSFPLSLDFYSYHLILLIFVRSRNFSRLPELESRIRAAGFEFDVTCHALMMEYYQWQQKWEKVLQHFYSAAKSSDANLMREPVFSQAIQAATLIGEHRRAKEIFDFAESKNVDLSNRTGYQFLFTSLKSCGEFERIIQIVRNIQDRDFIWHPATVRIVVEAVKVAGELAILPVIIAKSLSQNEKFRCDSRTLEISLESCLKHFPIEQISSTSNVSPPVFISLISLFKSHKIPLTCGIYFLSLEYFLHFGEWQQAEKIVEEMRKTINENEMSQKDFAKFTELELSIKQMAGKWEDSIQIMKKIHKRQSEIMDEDDRWDFSEELNSSEVFDMGISTLASAEEFEAILQLFFALELDSPFVPSSESCYLAINAAMAIKDWQAVLAIWHRMKNYGTQRGAKSDENNSPVTGKKKTRHFNSTAKSKNSSNEFDESELIIFDSVIYSCYRLAQFQLAESVFSALRFRRLSPFPSTFTSMIRVWTETEEWEKFHLLLESLQEEEFEQIEMAAINEIIKKFLTDCQNNPNSKKLFDAACQRLGHLMTQIGAISSAPANIKISSHPRDHRSQLFIPRSYQNRPNEFLSFPQIIRPMTAMSGAIINEGIGHVAHFAETENISACIQISVRLLIEAVKKSEEKNSSCQILILPPHAALVENSDRLCESALKNFNPPVKFGSLHVQSATIEAVMAVSEKRAKILKHSNQMKKIFETQGERKRNKKSTKQKNENDEEDEEEEENEHEEKNENEIESTNSSSSSLCWCVWVRSEEISRLAHQENFSSDLAAH